MDIEERKVTEINEDQEINIQEFVSIILKDKDGKLWLTKRINKEKPLYGKYSCPGGKMEENESQRQACSREIEEEHTSFFMMRTINQTLEIGQIETKNFKYENAKEWPDLLQQIKEWKDQRTGKTFQEWRNERRRIHKYCYITKWNVQSPK